MENFSGIFYGGGTTFKVLGQRRKTHPPIDDVEGIDEDTRC